MSFPPRRHEAGGLECPDGIIRSRSTPIQSSHSVIIVGPTIVTIRDPSVDSPTNAWIGTQHALGRGRRSPDELDTDLVALIDRLSRRFSVDLALT